MQLKKVNLEKVLFLDIETVPQLYNFSELDEKTAELYLHKNKYIQERDELSNDEVYEKAGIFAEFGKIVCISCGIVHDAPDGKSIRMKSFASDDEKQLLLDFAKMLNQNYNSPYHILCGHNAKEFDFPFLARRMLIHGIDLPGALDIAGKKPWEINHLDTMELWKFGDYKHYTSMSLLCHIFNVPTPKDDITGADVARVYYEENDLERIMVYCQKDVIALIQLFLRFRNEDLVDEANIVQ
ncbi:MAG: DNA polymerase elongation subunit (family B) [Crocinitomix sp.]|jgi:DNA polymerase elongation subunit (family B)